MHDGVTTHKSLICDCMISQGKDTKWWKSMICRYNSVIGYIINNQSDTWPFSYCRAFNKSLELGCNVKFAQCLVFTPVI